MLCLTILSGLMRFLVLSLSHLLVEMTVVSLWLAVHIQFRRKVSSKITQLVFLFFIIMLLISVGEVGSGQAIQQLEIDKTNV